MMGLGVSFPPPWAVFFRSLSANAFYLFPQETKRAGTCPRGTKIAFSFLLVKQIFVFFYFIKKKQ